MPITELPSSTEGNINHENFIKVLNEWCEEASGKGIAHLENFSNSLKGYRVI